MILPNYVADVPRLLNKIEVPLIAAVEGHAIGGGFVLGLWCDISIFSKESLYGANFMSLGFTPGMGCTYIVEKILGRALAMELIFTGKIVKGSELQGRDCQIQIISKSEVLTKAMDIAESIAKLPAISIRLLKKNIAANIREDLEKALSRESNMHEILFNDTNIIGFIQENYGA